MKLKFHTTTRQLPFGTCEKYTQYYAERMGKTYEDCYEFTIHHRLIDVGHDSNRVGKDWMVWIKPCYENGICKYVDTLKEAKDICDNY